MPIALLFPGQTSRYPGMLQKLLDAYPDVVSPLFRRASDVLGCHILASDRAAGSLPNTDVQTSVFLANCAHAEILRAAGIDGDYSIGLSLGEYNHLVHIGAIAFEHALRLVAARGAAYETGPAGVMAAVFPVEEAPVAAAVTRARARGVIEIANYNSPTQHVLAGDRPAIDEAMRILEDEESASGVITDERLPMHSSLFAPVAARFRASLSDAPFVAPRLPYVPNVLGTVMDAAAPDAIRGLLADHVQRPVRFRESIDALLARRPDCAFIEVGPKSVIYNLLGRKWHPFRRFKTDSDADLAGALSQMVKELRRAA